MDTKPNLHFKSITCTGLQPGPRLIVTGAVHGNETCGTRAIGRVMEEIDSGGVAIERGSVTFVPITNPLAHAKGERAGDRNLNRNLGPVESSTDFEDRVANWLCPLLARHDVLLDLHSTRAATEPFAMLGPKNNSGALEPFAQSDRERSLAKRLGVRRFVEGWLGTYAKGVERRVKEGRGGPLNTDPRYGIGTTEYMRSVGGYAVTLECGQHDDPSSPEIAHRAIRNALAFLGLTTDPMPESATNYEALRLHEVVDRDNPADHFSREWSSFDPLEPGDLIATRHEGQPVIAMNSGRILFPDAKALPGNEWFYLAETIGEI
jgi:predicted deacylase